MSKRQVQKSAGSAEPEAGISVARHPRSASAVRRAKGAGGLLGAVLAILLAQRAGLPAFDAMVRGIAGGIVGYIVMWAIAVAVARQLVVAEVRARYAELVEASAVAAEADAG